MRGVFSVFSVCFQCVLSVFSVCSQCVLSVFSVCFQCVFSVFSVCFQCVFSVFWWWWELAGGVQIDLIPPILRLTVSSDSPSVLLLLNQPRINTKLTSK